MAEPLFEAVADQRVMRGDALICITTAQAPEGSAGEIARALNRLPEAEALLIEIASAIRSGADAQPLADQIEEWVVG
jgi:hypothetical protein